MSESVLLSLLRRPVAFALAATALVSFLPGPRPAEARGEISGRATVIDGDTLAINGVHVRLEGIDAPETAQRCRRKWVGTWSCGTEAARHLSSLVAERRVTCERLGNDKYGRTLGLCTVDGRDLNREMVQSGFAWAFVKYSNRFVAEEAAARSAKVGIWQGDAEPAWDFRAKRWSTAEADAPSGCAIKGNVTENGNIYHMPWSPWYGKVKIEPAKGEGWFCSETQAAAAGFRPAMQH